MPVNHKLLISDDVNVYTAENNNYINVSFNSFPNKVEVTIHKPRDEKYITVAVSIITVTDEDLDLIVMTSDVKINNFLKDLESIIAKSKIEKIKNLQKELQELQENVSNS